MAEAYGSPAELKTLIDTAHMLGISVFLDVVYNHFGPDGNYLNAYAGAFFHKDVDTHGVARWQSMSIRCIVSSSTMR